MYVDLSVPINLQTPIYPGDPATKIEPAGVLAKDGFNDHYVSIGTHVGTHIDAQLHMIEGGQTLDQAPMDQFVGPRRLIKIEGQKFDLDAIKAANIQTGEIVLFDTGMASHYHEPAYFEDYPAMSEEIAKYLVTCKPKMVGFDTCSADNQDGFPIHKILLGGGVLIIENLTNLEALSGKEFTMYALPIKLEIDGAPARVIAQIN